jgi:copper(I)-binding protein
VTASAAIREAASACAKRRLGEAPMRRARRHARHGYNAWQSPGAWDLMNPTSVFRILASFAIALAAGAAFAHGYSAGDVRIEHPYATPTPPGAKIGAAYFMSLENRGEQADRLLRASSPVAAGVELHSGDIGADGVMRMRELDALPIPSKAVLELRPGHGNHLMLMGLKQPLVEGQSFPMTLEFERGGKIEVQVKVQLPKDHSGHVGGNKH